MGSLGFMVAREVQDVWGHFQKCEANVVEGGRLSLLINISWCHCQGSDIVGDLLSHANVPFQNGRNQKGSLALKILSANLSAVLLSLAVLP